METQYTVRAYAAWTTNEKTCPLWAARHGTLGSIGNSSLVYLSLCFWSYVHVRVIHFSFISIVRR